MNRRFKLTLLRDDQISGTRRAVAILLAAVIALISSLPDFLDWPRNVPALIGLMLISLTAAAAGTVAFGRVGRGRWEKTVEANLGTIRRSARAIPQQRQAPVLSDFRGRTDELARWQRVHDELRRLRERGGPQNQNPVILAMHGPPGSGKSALAHALARKLAPKYDQIVVANFGASGTARSPADITRDILLQLGWPDEDMPHETADRVATLRSLTRNKKILFLFDAVRDHDQVAHVIPAEPKGAVIITSRREIGTSLGLPSREPVAPASLHDSLEMLTAISGLDWTTDPEAAVEVVELCGHVPLAIRAAAERVRDGQDLRYVAATLRPAIGRTIELTYAGRSIHARIESEFKRLNAMQQRALTLLASMDSESFVPWVLRPLLDVDRGLSRGIVAGLASAQFLEIDGRDSSRRPRYRIPPIMRLFAIEQQNPEDVRLATQRVNEAYLELIDDVLVEYDPTYRPIRSGPRQWRSEGSTIATTLAETLDGIIRREYLNLVRVILAADPVTYQELIWRVAALLDGRIPALPPGPRLIEEQIVQIEAAFARGIAAAEAAGTIAGQVYVHTGRAQFLAAVERYTEARSALETAERIVDAGARPPGETAALRLRIARVRTWLLLEAGASTEAERVLTQAWAHAQHLTEEDRRRPQTQVDIAILSQFNAGVDRQAASQRWEQWLTAKAPADGIADFHATLATAESLRRKGYWDDAATTLRRVLGQDFAARSHSSVHYRMALFRIEQARYPHADAPQAATTRTRRQRVIRSAIEHAAACVLTYGAIDDKIGQLRGRALLIRALVLANKLMAATQLDLELKASLDRIAEQREPNVWIESLRAHYQQAHAELELAQNRPAAAYASVAEAVQIFHNLGDWRNHGDAWRLLQEIYLRMTTEQAEAPKAW
jgi:DNA polymerase III delta prime subunit